MQTCDAGGCRVNSAGDRGLTPTAHTISPFGARRPKSGDHFVAAKIIVPAAEFQDVGIGDLKRIVELGENH